MCVQLEYIISCGFRSIGIDQFLSCVGTGILSRFWHRGKTATNSVLLKQAQKETTETSSVLPQGGGSSFLQSKDETGMHIYEHLNNSLTTETPTPSISTMATSNK